MGLKKPSTKLPTLTNPAVADEIFYKKEAINQNGEVMTGNVINVNSSTSLGTPSVSGSNLVLNSAALSNGLHINKNGKVGLTTALSNLGNAAAADVASGKTFTSAAGLKVTGTSTKKEMKYGNHTPTGASNTLTIDGIGDFDNIILVCHPLSNYAQATRAVIVIKFGDTIGYYITITNNTGSVYYYTDIELSGDTFTLLGTKVFSEYEFTYCAWND